MAEDEVDHYLDARKACNVLEQVEALAGGARRIVDHACSEDRLSLRAAVAMARPLVEELRQMSETAVAALDNIENAHASRGRNKVVGG